MGPIPNVAVPMIRKYVYAFVVVEYVVVVRDVLPNVCEPDVATVIVPEIMVFKAAGAETVDAATHF